MAVTRYLVEDVDRSVRFYDEHFGFELERRYGPFVAIVVRGDQTLWLSGPRSSAVQTMPDGRGPAPGGWNRMVLQTQDIAADVQRLRAAGVRLRGGARHRGGRELDPARGRQRQPDRVVPTGLKLVERPRQA